MILTGGLGIRLKQHCLRESKQKTLIEAIPEAHVTQDIDVFLNLQMWLEPERAIAFRAMLNRLGYEVARHSWHFKKPLLNSAEVLQRFVSLEFQARTPLESEQVKIQKKQVGKGMGTDLAGYHTPEAFAVYDSPVSLTLLDELGRIRVPNPYAWLNLKVAAAYDWLKEQRGEIEPRIDRETGMSRRLKHVYDVYVLVAMLTEQERTEAIELAQRYENHLLALAIADQAVELYADPKGKGIQGAQLYAYGSLKASLSINHEEFWEEGLKPALGIF